MAPRDWVDPARLRRVATRLCPAARLPKFAAQLNWRYNSNRPDRRPEPRMVVSVILGPSEPDGGECQSPRASPAIIAIVVLACLPTMAFGACQWAFTCRNAGPHCTPLQYCDDPKDQRLPRGTEPPYLPARPGGWTLWPPGTHLTCQPKYLCPIDRSRSCHPTTSCTAGRALAPAK